MSREGLFAGDPELLRLDFGSHAPVVPRVRFRSPSAASALKGRMNGIRHSRLIRAGLRGLKVLDALLSARRTVVEDGR